MIVNDLSQKAICIVPCYNESNRFNLNYWVNLTTENFDVEWYFVNDGSTDNTNSVLFSLMKLNSINVHIVDLPRNVGKGNAIRSGLVQAISENSKAKVAMYVDSDGAFEGADIVKIKNLHLDHLEIDCYMCARIKLGGRAINRSTSRHVLGRIVATVIGLNWSCAPYDTQTGLKSFRIESNLKQAIEIDFKTRWFFDLELLMRLEALNRRKLYFWEEPATTWRDVAGSKMNTFQMFLAFMELMKVLRILRKAGRVNGLA